MIIEDGTGVEDANSYASIAFADAYNADRGNLDWDDEDDATKAALLIRATDLLEARYSASRARLNPLQGLQAPTINDTRLHPAIRAATAILALAARQEGFGVETRGIKSTKDSLEGVGSLEVVYDNPVGGDPFPLVTGLLAGVMELRTSDTVTVTERRLIR